MIKGRSTKNIPLNKSEKNISNNLEKIKEKQLQNIEYLKNLEENLKKHSNKIKGGYSTNVKSSNQKLKQNTSIEKYIISKNIDDSNNNNSTKISSLTNNLSENRLKVAPVHKESSLKKSKHKGTSLKEYLNFKLSKIESQEEAVDDEVEQLKKCLVSYVDISAKKRNKSELQNNSYHCGENRTPNFKNKSFSHKKSNKKECDLSGNEIFATSSLNLTNKFYRNSLGENTNEKQIFKMRKNGSCNIRLNNNRNSLFRKSLNSSQNQNYGNISENQLFTENNVDSKNRNSKSNISEDYPQQYDKVTKQKIVIFKRILSELVEKSSIYPFLNLELESYFKETFGSSTNQSFLNQKDNTAMKSFFENQSEENLFKTTSKFMTGGDDDLTNNPPNHQNIRRENLELKHRVNFLEKKLKIYEKENEDLRIYFSTNYEKKDTNKMSASDTRITEKYRNRKNVMNNIEELETLSNNSEENKENNDVKLKSALKLKENYHTDAVNYKSTIKELEDKLDTDKGIITEGDYESNKEILNEGNLLENNISLDNLETEIKKVELEMKFSSENLTNQNDFNSNLTIKFKKNISSSSQNSSNKNNSVIEK